MGSSRAQLAYVKRMRSQPIEPSKHGHISTYTNAGCRCEDCRRANSEYMKAYRQRAKSVVN